MSGPTKSSPKGWIYVISAEALYTKNGRPLRGKYHTKIGLTGSKLTKGSGRCQTAEFWLMTLGLGGILIHDQFFHDEAFYIEKQFHADLVRDKLQNDNCGKSRESFNIDPDTAVRRLKLFVEEFGVGRSH